MNFNYTHLTLENWRNFRQVDLPLRERVFVVGPNASGKTNFLDAFKFLADIAKPKGSLAGAVESRGGFGRIRSLHAHGKDQHVKISVQLTRGDVDWRYELAISGKRSRCRARGTPGVRRGRERQHRQVVCEIQPGIVELPVVRSSRPR